MIEEKLERIATALEQIAEKLSSGITEAPIKTRTRNSKKKAEAQPEVEQQVQAMEQPILPTLFPTDAKNPIDETPAVPFVEPTAITPSDVREYTQKVVQAIASEPNNLQQRFITFVQTEVCPACCPAEPKLIKMAPEKASYAMSVIKLWVKNNVSNTEGLL